MRLVNEQRAENKGGLAPFSTFGQALFARSTPFTTVKPFLTFPKGNL